MEYRYRMQSIRTGWGVEAEGTLKGKEELLKVRRKSPEMFKFCRVFLTRQFIPSHHDYLEPFKLTSRRDRLG